MSNRDSFVFYREWYEIVTNCDEQTQLSLYRAIMDYVFLGTIPTDPALQLVFPLIKARLDSDCAKWSEVKEKRRQAILKRWHGGIQMNTNEYKCIQMNTNEYKSIQTNTNDTVYVNVNGLKDTNVSMYNNNNLKEAKASSSSCDDSAIDFVRLMRYWNDKMRGKAIPQIQKLTDRRKAMVRARLKEYNKEAVFRVINNASESQFLNGGGDRGAVFDFDWIFRPNNFPKVLEGYYNINRNNNGTNRTNNTQEQRLSEASNAIMRRLAEDGIT